MKPHFNRLTQRWADLSPGIRVPLGRRILAFIMPCDKSDQDYVDYGYVRKALLPEYRDIMPENEYILERKHWLNWLGQYFPVRHRYILTRSNRLRLRYVLPSAACCLTLTLTGLGGAVKPSQAVGMFQASAVARQEATADSVDSAAMGMATAQKRLSRYAKETGTAKNDGELQAGLQLASFVPPEVKPPPEPREETLKIGKGDTLAGVLQRAGVGAGDAYKAVMAMQDIFDPRKIRPGQEVHVRFDPLSDDNYEFSQLQIGLDALRSLSLVRGKDGGFETAVEEKDVVKQVYANRADIQLSLYGSAAQAGIPMPVIAQAIHIYSWDVDFQRDIRKGDFLEVLYEQYETEAGDKVKNGDVIYARLNVNGQDIPVYRFETEDGDVDYYTAEGKSIRKALMQTPIDGARLSSGFGKRHHPVLGYAKMHKGVDFAAPRGTPIYAAGDGTIEKAGPWSSYGNYVRIRHNGTLKTAYAHLKGFAKGITPGARVKQGQVIGYVGTTGRSTGPHLHYEVLENGRQVNPKSVKMPQGNILKGAQIASFKKHIESINHEYALLSGSTKMASR